MLVVDLDGTLIKTDLLHESAIKLLSEKPWMLPVIFIWLLRGKAHLKRRLAESVDVGPASLPYRDVVLDLIKERKKSGDQVVLATAASEKYAHSIASHLGFFDQVIATQDENLTGEKKLRALKVAFGDRPFSYAGDSLADAPLWRACGYNGYVVNPSFFLRWRLSSFSGRLVILKDSPKLFPTLARALRVHQWFKNVLLLVPVLTADQWRNPEALLSVLLGMLSFSLTASGIYVVNDLMDLEADRLHHRRKRRPFASGALGVFSGVALAPILFAAGLFVSFLLPPDFTGILLVYVGVSICYNFFLKRVMLLDVLVLAFLYSVRFFAGGAATGIHVSKWLLAFSLFFFFGLAMLKRFIELRNSSSRGVIPRRGYQRSDALPAYVIGVAGGFLSLVVFALYLNGPDVMALYSQPERLWLILPVLLYWKSRLWMLTYRRLVHDDPVIFALKDRVSYFCGVISMFFIFFAR